MDAGPIEVKVCIIGDSDVGKTSLSMRYCHGHFPENASPTIGASFLQKRIEVQGSDISLQIWDTAGQERFRSMAPMYYRGAKAAILVFDLGNPDSFHHAMSWLKDLKAHADADVVLCLVGNKCDRPTNVDLKAIDSLARSIDAKFVKCSALTGEGVDSAFTALATKIVDSYKAKPTKAKDPAISLSAKVNEEPTGGCCS